jgi:molybdopterin converting factor small subunit
MIIQIGVRFLGTFQRLSGKKHVKLTLEEPVTVRMVITKLTESFSSDFKQFLIDSDLDDPRPKALIIIDGKEISALQGLETEVKDSEEIVLIPLVHGG